MYHIQPGGKPYEDRWVAYAEYLVVFGFSLSTYFCIHMLFVVFVCLFCCYLCCSAHTSVCSILFFSAWTLSTWLERTHACSSFVVCLNFFLFYRFLEVHELSYDLAAAILMCLCLFLKYSPLFLFLSFSHFPDASAGFGVAHNTEFLPLLFSVIPFVNSILQLLWFGRDQVSHRWVTDQHLPWISLWKVNMDLHTLLPTLLWTFKLFWPFCWFLLWCQFQSLLCFPENFKNSTLKRESQTFCANWTPVLWHLKF